MSGTYHQLPTNPDGTLKSFDQRAKERREAEAAKPATAPPVIEHTELTYAQRSALRHAEYMGKQQADALAIEQERARQQTELLATPEHLRKPSNTWRDLLCKWEGVDTPEGARRRETYERMAGLREKEIEAEMKAKMQRYLASTNPETKHARELLDRLATGATEDERLALARVAGMVEAGQAEAAYGPIAEVTAARLERARAALAEHAERTKCIDAEHRALAQQVADAEAALADSQAK